MTTTDPTPAQVLACPMEPNDADAPTIGDYLVTLLAELWRDPGYFSGKKPFGNSGWDGDLQVALVRAGYVDGEIDDDGYLDAFDDKRADRLISEAITSLRPVPNARPEVVVLCGSTRFYDAFQQANYELTMAGHIVLSVGFYPHAKAIHGHGEGVGHDSAEKVALDELHLRKIDMADSCFVISVGGYLGESTRSEIAYALAHGKPVRFMEPEAEVNWNALAEG